jgi:hypothetical protein
MKKFLCGLLALTSSAFALIDSNGNGMSDLWEKVHNSGNLFPTNFDPLADPDNDNWTNAQEAAAGTSPFEPNPPVGYVQLQITQVAAVYITSPEGGDPELLTPEAFVTSWPTLTGKQYTLLCSPDLATGGWLPVGEPLTGDGLNAEIAISPSYGDGTLPDKLFWRVAVDDIDTDGDSFTNYEEFQLGSDPASIDTDLDGITDNLDPFPLASATVADPDGVNPPLGSTANLRGFWDFESQQGAGYPAIFPDRSGANRHATSSGPGPQSLGIPSQAGRVGPGYITIPDTTVEGQAAYTVSGWFKLAKDSIKTSNGIHRVIYALYDQQGTGPAPQHAPLAQGTILALRITASGEQWFLGGYQQSAYYNQPPYTNGNPITSLDGHAFTRPAGTSDDGKWHHFAATRSTASNGQKLYLDGQLVIEGALKEYAVAYDSDTTFTFGSLYPDHSFTNLPDAHIDRLRVHSRLLTQTEVTGLYHQDIDSDGLWDITETHTRLWRDINSDGQATANEQQFSVSPFNWQVATSDTDDDELPDLTEQALGTGINNPDTDGDLLPDGWENSYGMSPLIPGDATANPDNDGLNNLDEYRYNTKPNDANSDGDGKNDGTEVNQGSDPNDASDGGNPIPVAETTSILLGIGDKSGSHSEDYVLNCYQIDPQSGQEKRFYTLRSGGFGEYKEETRNFFKKGETYTFQIDWQSSNMSVKASTPGSPTEGPDYDYTFKVQPQGSETGFLIDAYDSKKHTTSTSSPILASAASDVATTETEFKQNYENKRVVLLSPDPVPESLTYNGDFDEGNAGGAGAGATGAQNDIQTLSLKAARGSVDGRITADQLVTDDLYQGWFGFNPGKVPKGCLDNATVTVRKVAATDPDTGKNEAGQIRLHSTWGGTHEKNAEPYSIVQDIITENATPINLASKFYSKSAAIPAGASYWIEGSMHGPVTLEFKCQLGITSYTMQKAIPIRCHWSKTQWQTVLRDELYLDSFTSSSGSAINELPQTGIDIANYTAANGFLNNRKYLYTVYEFYKKLQDENSEEFLWAGLAKMAGAPVHAGLSDAQQGRDGLSFPTFGLIDSAALNSIQDILIEANINIYNDLAYQFVAYRTAGIEEMEQLLSGSVAPTLAAWQQIHDGYISGNAATIAGGNEILLQREQQVILEPTYIKLKNVENIYGLISVSWMFSHLAANPIPSGLSFQTVVPGGDITVFNDRWLWITHPSQGMWPLWNSIEKSTRKSIASIRLISRAEDYSLLDPIR